MKSPFSIIFYFCFSESCTVRFINDLAIQCVKLRTWIKFSKVTGFSSSYLDKDHQKSYS